MKRMMNPKNRTALLAAFALQGAAFGLVSRDAHATTWSFTVVDGAGSSGHGNSGNSTTASVNGATAAFLDSSGHARPLYSRSGDVFGGSDSSYGGGTCNGTDGFTISSVDTTGALHGPAALFDTSTSKTTIVYTDSVGDVIASTPSSSGPTAGAKILSASCNFFGVTGFPAIAEMSGTPVVFYSFGGEIFSQHFDGTEWQPTAGNPCSSVGDHVVGTGPSGNDVEDPTAAVFDISGTPNYFVFYHDTTNHCMRGSVTSNSNGNSGWGNAPGTSSTHSFCIDGNGQNTVDDVGFSPVAFVDTANSLLHVFYADTTSHTLRESFFDGSSWHTLTVDSSVTISSPASGEPGKMIAPLFNSGASAMQVYYIDSTNHTMRHATKGSTLWGSTVVTDGSGCTTGCGTTDHIDGPISAVERLDCDGAGGGSSVNQPHVFYQDASVSALREAFVDQ